MDIVPLDDDLVMDLYNISYDEFHKRIVQAQRKHFLDDHALPSFTKERVIVVDTCKNQNAIVEANLAFRGATRSNTQYFTTNNKKLAQNLNVSQQEIEQLHAATQNTIFA